MRRRIGTCALRRLRRSFAFASSVLLVPLLWSQPSSGLTLAIDLDPTTPGIQSTLTVGLGATFGADLVLVGDGVATLDELLVDVGYNDAGLVLASGPGSVVALALSATVPMAWDSTVPSVGPPLPAPPAPLVPLGLTPVGPFTASEGGFGYYTTPGSFPVVGSGVTITVAGFSLTAVGIGTSAVAPIPTGGGAALFLSGSPVPSTFLAGAVTVIPEPTTCALTLFGMAALCAGRRCRRL